MPTKELSSDAIFITLVPSPSVSTLAGPTDEASESPEVPPLNAPIPLPYSDSSSREVVDIPLDKSVEKSAPLGDIALDKRLDKSVEKQVNASRVKPSEANLQNAKPVKVAVKKQLQANQFENETPNMASTASDAAVPNQDLGPVDTVVVSQLDYRSRPPKPEYPAMAARSRQQGKVVIRLLISTTGDVMSASVVQSAGSDLLDQSALVAAQQAKFVPYTRGGRQYQAQADVPFEFVLKPR